MNYPPYFIVNDNGVSVEFRVIDKTIPEETANKMNIAGNRNSQLNYFLSIQNVLHCHIAGNSF
jgi:hypothetical protein